jgi:hypothetical protein
MLQLKICDAFVRVATQNVRQGAILGLAGGGETPLPILFIKPVCFLLLSLCYCPTAFVRSKRAESSPSLQFGPPPLDSPSPLMKSLRREGSLSMLWIPYSSFVPLVSSYPPHLFSQICAAAANPASIMGKNLQIAGAAIATKAFEVCLTYRASGVKYMVLRADDTIMWHASPTCSPLLVNHAHGFYLPNPA